MKSSGNQEGGFNDMEKRFRVIASKVK